MASIEVSLAGRRRSAGARDLSRELDTLRAALTDKDTLIQNLKKQLNASLSAARLAAQASSPCTSPREEAPALSADDRRALEERAAAVRAELETRRANMQELKRRLEKTHVTENIDTRIEQAELQYAIGREELELLTLGEQARALSMLIEQADVAHRTTLYSTDSFDMINRDLVNISVWSRRYGLNINPGKSQVIIIGSPSLIARVDKTTLSPIVYNGSSLPYCATAKDLGVHLDQTLSWSAQLKEVSRKTFAALSSLRRLKSFLPIPTKIMLANSLLLSILDYADASYLNLTEDQLNKLERLQNLAIRFIFCLRKYDHVSEFRSKLKWLPIRSRRNLHILSLLYCALFDPKAPSYLRKKFEFLGEQSSLRSSRRLMLKLPVHKTRFFSQSFTVQAIKLWNDLPLYIKEAKSLPIFKNSVKRHYLNNVDDSN
ncbi:unnamed protein product [Euphydryas editha]|uniref:Reverse transcriptase n=1 Tax=Euphydryas editha TaxID=104508 RepID=A0AAU9TJB8_EUPED|nr:unnamed protein product [Euphydryas editha]